MRAEWWLDAAFGCHEPASQYKTWHFKQLEDKRVLEFEEEHVPTHAPCNAGHRSLMVSHVGVWPLMQPGQS